MILSENKISGKPKLGLYINKPVLGQDFIWDRLNTIISNLSIVPLKN